MRLATSFLATFLALGAVSAAGGAAFLVVGAPAARAADTPADPWAEIKELEKAKDEGKCVAKMQEYKDKGGAGAIANLRGLKDSKLEKVACSAIRMVAATADPDLHKWLAGKIEDKDLADPKDGRPNVYMAVLEGLVPYGEKNKANGIPDKLLKTVQKYQGTKPDYATRAVRAYATIPDKFTVDELLKLGLALDSRSGKGGGGSGNSKGASQETRDNEAKVRTTVLEGINELTGQDVEDLETFKKWWEEKRAKFEFTKKGAGGGGAGGAGGGDGASDTSNLDFASMKEFNDEAYGYLAKKPDDAGWLFEKADYKGPRIAMTYASPDDPAYRLARVYFSIHDPKQYPPKDIKGFVEWAKTEIYAKQMDTHDRPIEVRDIALAGGVMATVTVGKGDGKDVKSSWGTMERRIYFVQIGSKILWIDAFVRSGAEDEVKAALWKTVEATVVSKK